MSLKKKDPSLRVAANDPHLVSLGGGRLSTAVTIHNIPIGDTTIGSSPSCNISINGSGVRGTHCTIYRSEENDVTLAPESEARVLIDGNKIVQDTQLTQGAMITIGNSNYLRFNNPAEAQMIRSVMGSNERISMPQIDFTQRNSIKSNGSHKTTWDMMDIDSFYEKNINPVKHAADYEQININGLHCPKVFTADLVTVNLPAKDVLGQKYANFAKNLAENHRNNDKNVRNNQMPHNNLNNSFIQNNTKISERYPQKNNLQVFHMNGVNSEMNQEKKNVEEHLEDMLKICTEYADRQQQQQQQQQQQNGVNSSPIVQNRIKTNGSLPREKKSPFYGNEATTTTTTSGTTVNGQTTSGYENIKTHGVEIVNNNNNNNNSRSGYENVVVGKYVPQSPRTKIRTTCMSPKKEHTFNNSPFINTNITTTTTTNGQNNVKQQEYIQLIKTFEQKLQLELKAIEESSRYKPPTPPKPPGLKAHSLSTTPLKRLNKNINNLSLNLQQQSRSLQNSPVPQKKPAPAPRAPLILTKPPLVKKENTNIDEEIAQLKALKQSLLQDQQRLKTDIHDLQQQDEETVRELNMENALVLAEVSNLTKTLQVDEQKFQELRNTIHRLEAQRNATRVMEETQQAKLKQSIEIKQEQVKKLKELLEQKKPNNECLKEELQNVIESLENDRKTFEDLEFHYLEEESDWHAYREDLNVQEHELSQQINNKRRQLQQLRKEQSYDQAIDTQQLHKNMSQLLQELQVCEENLKTTDSKLHDISQQICKEVEAVLAHKNVGNLMSQSLFGSSELISHKPADEDLMSKSVNENMFFSNVLESTSTPKRAATLKIATLAEEVEELSPNERMKFNLSLGSDDFEVNPLEKRVPSQDDIDRICKVTSNAPISTKGASSKIFDSIKEIERNRQLLLAQQGHHVIEHERQRMFDLKKRSHDEARAQYLSMSSGGSTENKSENSKLQSIDNNTDGCEVFVNSDEISFVTGKTKNATAAATTTTTLTPTEMIDNEQRHSQPEFAADEQRGSAHLLTPISRSPRPLSTTNSDLSCDILTDASHHFHSNHNNNNNNNVANKSNLELNALSVLKRYSAERAAHEESEAEAERKRSSLNSTETNSAGGGSASSGGSGSGAYTERKRNIPKHQRPLTRYLPIFSPDLNLKHHIETAGHQLALCPYVFVDALTCRGYLHKLGATFHTWSRRWFVLNRQHNTFIYYADKSERKPRGGAYFSTIDEVYMDHLNASKSGRPHCTFVVKTKKRSYHLQAASDAAARIWIDAIITGAQGNMDY